MRFKSALVFAGLVLFSPAMRAQVPHTVPSGSSDRWTAKSGAALSEDCLTAEGSPQHAECVAYIIGQVDMIGNLQGSLSDGELVNLWKVRPICIPNDTTPRHVADVVIKFIKEHPKRSTESSSAIIISALATEWGCPFAAGQKDQDAPLRAKTVEAQTFLLKDAAGTLMGRMTVSEGQPVLELYGRSGEVTWSTSTRAKLLTTK